MKKILVLLLFSLPLTAAAQLPNTTYLTGYAGISNPSNQDLYTTSFTAGAGIEFALSKITAFGFDANFANFASKKNDVELAYWGFQLYNYGSYSTMGFMAFFKLQDKDAVTNAVQPFAKIGLGASLIARTGVSFKQYGMITNVQNETSTGLLFAPSIGINIPLHAKNKIVLEAQYRINKSDSQDVKAILLTAGYSFRL